MSLTKEQHDRMKKFPMADLLAEFTKDTDSLTKELVNIPEDDPKALVKIVHILTKRVETLEEILYVLMVKGM